MNKRYLTHTTTALAAFLGFMMNGTSGSADERGQRFQQWGEEALRQTHEDLWIEERQLYAERARFTEEGTRRDHPAFMWGVGIQLPALVAAAELDPDTYLEKTVAFARQIDVYWHDHDGLAGYDVLPVPKPVDRYYDDNAWLVLGLADLYVVSGMSEFLDRSKATFEFVMSGEDDKLGGGLYWRENELSSKNTCTNAPTIVSALLLHKLTGEDGYMEIAHRVHQWTHENLQDPDDGLFWDAMRMDGTINERKWTYNSALMIRANVLYYEVTGEESYLEKAQRIARAADDRWGRDNGAIGDEAQFAHLLSEAYIFLHEQDNDPRWLEIVDGALTFLYNEVRDPEGRYGRRWDRPQPEPLEQIEILHMASAARGFLMGALAFKADANDAEADES